jgi:large conductance mechanosensitive channel
MNKIRREKADEPAVAPAPTTEEMLLTEIRDLLKTQQTK